jgi:hypothetical protein
VSDIITDAMLGTGHVMPAIRRYFLVSQKILSISAI